MTNEFYCPPELYNLPVPKAIREGRIKPEGNFIIVAATGSGKTMIIPPYMVMKTGKKGILRQPTRGTARSTYLALKKFWGDKLKIGMHTSEVDEGTPETHDLIVVTDGVMRNWLKTYKYPMIFFEDEFHWQLPVTEIEFGLVKTYIKQGRDMNLVLLSATIRPDNVLKYMDINHTSDDDDIRSICDTLEQHGELVNTMPQDQYLKLYYGEGITHPIENRIIRTDPNDDEGEERKHVVKKWAKKMADEKKRGLLFTTTRAQTQEYQHLIQTEVPDLPTIFAHADVSIDEVIRFVNETEPSIVTATVALATSITLPFDEVMIIDRGIDSIWEDGIQKQITNIEKKSNQILQERGRVGRIKPGVCTLLSEFRKSWDQITPQSIQPPLEKTSPDEIVMTCASYKLDARGIDIMSNIDHEDISRSVSKLMSYGLIEEITDDGVTLSLTKFGHRVFNIPLELGTAIFVAGCDPVIRPAIIAIASTDQEGFYSMFQHKIKAVDGSFVEGIDLIDPELTDDKSCMIALAKIIQAALRSRDKENTDVTLTTWANENGLYPKKISKMLHKMYQICDSMGLSEPKLRHELMEMDINKIKPEIFTYIKQQKIFERGCLRLGSYKNKKSYSGMCFVGERDYFSTISDIDLKMLKIGDNGKYPEEVNIIGKTKIFKSGKGNDICGWVLPTILSIDEW